MPHEYLLDSERREHEVSLKGVRGGGRGWRPAFRPQSHLRNFLLTWSLHRLSFSCGILEGHWKSSSRKLFPSGKTSIHLLRCL